MIYFVVTYNSLHRSKKFLDTIEEVNEHISSLISKLKYKPTEEDLENSISIVKIDDNLVQEYPKLFKPMEKICSPWSHKDQLKKEREEEKEFSDFKKKLRKMDIL